jgi:protein-disulfide isomerase
MAIRRDVDDPTPESPVQVSNWAELQSAAVESASSRLTGPRVVTFVDFECPACRGFAKTLDSLTILRHDSVLETAYLHFPLSYHPNAQNAARLFVCAAQHLDARGRAELATWLYERSGAVDQGALASLPSLPGLPPLTELERCSRDSGTDARISHHVKLAEAAGLKGTPTVIVDGWRFPGVPSVQALDSALAASTP